MEVKNHNRDYDRNGRDGHHHRQVDACEVKDNNNCRCGLRNFNKTWFISINTSKIKQSI